MEPPASTPLRIEDLLAHVGWVRGLARRLLGDPDQAEDLVQEAYVAALERPPSSPVPPRAWLAGVVHNLARMRRRGEGRRARREQAVAEARRPDISTVGAVARMETQRMLADAVLRLPEPYRTTVVLRHLDGLSSAEIARREDVPAATVRSRLKRGLDLLRGDLDRRHGGDRGAWRAALVPILEGPAPALPDATPAGTGWGFPLLLEGLIAMKTTTKIALAAMLLVAATGAAWLLDLLPGRDGPAGRGDLSAELAWRPLRPEEKDLAARLRGRPSSAPAAGADDRPGAVVPSADPGVAKLVMRFVDGHGRGLSGVHLASSSGGRRPTVHDLRSDGTGRLEVAVRATSHPGLLRWHAIATGFATAVVEGSARAGETTHLGDVPLGPGGALEGTVVDVEGRPAPGARVHATPPELPAYARMRALVTGPSEQALPFAVASDEEGRFRLTGLPVGLVRVWAVGEGTRHAFSRPVDIRADQLTEGVRLALEPLRPEDTVEGIVRLPSGEPAAGAQVRFLFRRRGGTTSSSVTADDAGRFTVLVPGDGKLEVIARSLDGTLHAEPVKEVRPGARDVELLLREPARLTVRVRSRGGPLETFEANILANDRTSLSTWSGEGPHQGGEVTLDVPFGTFHVAVEAPGHARLIEGPYDGASIPAEVTVVLEEIPGLTGRVLAEAEPVAGAEVRLHREASADETILHNGFPVRVDPQAVARATTDQEGRFRLDVRQDATYRLRAWAEGFAPAEQRDLVLEPAAPAGPYELVLTAGGAIEGRVRLAGRVAGAGVVVGISRGDAYALSTRTDAEGRYRFDHLTPGPWEVRLLDQEISSGSSSTSVTSGPKAEPIAYSCEVVEGLVTRHDLGDGTGTRARLEGRIRLGAARPTGWRARLRKPGVVTMQAEADATVDAAGRFVLEVREPGAYVLNVAVTGEDDTETMVVAFVTLTEGTTSWTLDLDAGALRGVVRNTTLAPGERLLHLWWDGSDTYVLSPILPDEDGRFDLDLLPAGAGRIVHLDRRAMMSTTTETRPRPETWKTLATCDVVPDETREVTVD